MTYISNKEMDLYARCPLLHLNVYKYGIRSSITPPFSMNKAYELHVNIIKKRIYIKIAEETLRNKLVPSPKRTHDIADKVIVDYVEEINSDISEFVDDVMNIRNFALKVSNIFSKRRSPVSINYTHKFELVDKKAKKNIQVKSEIDLLLSTKSSLYLVYIGIEEEPLSKLMFANTATFACYALTALDLKKKIKKNYVIEYQHVSNLATLKLSPVINNKKRYTSWVLNRALPIKEEFYYPNPGDYCNKCPFIKGCLP